MPASRRSWSRAAALLAEAWFLLARTSAGAGGPNPSSTGTKLTTHPAVHLASRFAAEKLGNPRCQSIYTEFTDGAGRPLRVRLEELGLSPTEHLAGLVFEEGDPEPLCHEPDVMAFTSPFNRIVHVCTWRFVRTMQTSPGFAAATVLHEQLHTLGLGENPPAPLEITERVLALCGR